MFLKANETKTIKIKSIKIIICLARAIFIICLFNLSFIIIFSVFHFCLSEGVPCLWKRQKINTMREMRLETKQTTDNRVFRHSGRNVWSLKNTFPKNSIQFPHLAVSRKVSPYFKIIIETTMWYAMFKPKQSMFIYSCLPGHKECWTPNQTADCFIKMKENKIL